MSSYENGPEKPQPKMAYPNEATNDTPYEILNFPEVIDEAWCDMVTEVYKDSPRLVKVSATSFLKEVLQPLHPEAQKSYQSSQLAGLDSGPSGIQGRMAGIKMWRVWDDESLGPSDYPHVIIKEARVEGQPVPLTQTPDQEVLVRLGHNLRQLVLFLDE